MIEYLNKLFDGGQTREAIIVDPFFGEEALQTVATRFTHADLRLTIVASWGSDLPPPSRTSVMAVKSVNLENDRLELVAVAASPAVVLLEEELKPHHRALMRLSEGTQLGDLQVEEREALTNWSESLSSSVDVEGTTAWLLSERFSLPVLDPKFHPRSYDLPDRPGVLTLRSLSPAREEHAGADDGH